MGGPFPRRAVRSCTESLSADQRDAAKLEPPFTAAFLCAPLAGEASVPPITAQPFVRDLSHKCSRLVFLFSIFHHMLFHFPRLLGPRLRAVSKCLHISIFSYFLACDSRRSSYFSFPCRVLDSRWVVQAQHCYEDIHTFLSRGHGPSAAL